MRRMHREGMGVRKISALVGRSFETISKHIFKKNLRKKAQPEGRPSAIDKATLGKLKTTHERLPSQRPTSDVTIKEVKAKAGVTCSDRTVLNAFHKDGIYFRGLYEKPEITDKDRRLRLAFAEEHGHRTPEYWQTHIHAFIDNKTFQVYTHGKARDYAARRKRRGAYRKRCCKLTKAYTKPPASLKQNFGAKSQQVTCAIGAGRVLMWYAIPNNSWTAKAADRMYRKVLHPTKKDSYPAARSFRVLEDNDPTGYKSRMGHKAKKDVNISAFSLPPRSPDLNPLDYTIWAEVNRRMRAQEKKWKAEKTETRAQYLRRLRRTAMDLPAAYINKGIGNLTKRLARLKKARGGHFPEGGV